MVRVPDQGEVSPRVENRPARLPTLTGMRGVAALLVFFFHVVFLVNLYSSSTARNVHQTIIWQGGWSGVEFFFILSGFVLAWSARTGDTARTFWRRRFFKIYPNHLVTFVAAAVLLTSAANAAINPRYAVTNVLLIQSWFPQLPIRSAFNGPTWSISCEALFYFSFPLLLRLVGRIRPERLWAWAGGVVATIVAVPIVAILVLPKGPALPVVHVDSLEFWIIYQFPPLRMLDFVFGIILARIVMTGRRVPLRLGPAVALALVAYVVGSLVPEEFSVVAVMVVPLGLVIAAAAKSDAQGRRGWWSGRVMVWLGEVSFAFYMWHSLVITYGYQWLGGRAASVPVALGEVALLLAVTLLLSWLQFTRIETPMMRRFAVSRRALNPQ